MLLDFPKTSTNFYKGDPAYPIVHISEMNPDCYYVEIIYEIYEYETELIRNCIADEFVAEGKFSSSERAKDRLNALLSAMRVNYHNRFIFSINRDTGNIGVISAVNDTADDPIVCSSRCSPTCGEELFSYSSH